MEITAMGKVKIIDAKEASCDKREIWKTTARNISMNSLLI